MSLTAAQGDMFLYRHEHIHNILLPEKLTRAPNVDQSAAENSPQQIKAARISILVVGNNFDSSFISLKKNFKAKMAKIQRFQFLFSLVFFVFCDSKLSILGFWTVGRTKQDI